MIWRMATPFDTDYSFLNLPEAGSDVRGPIELPSFEAEDSSFNIGSYAPIDLPSLELFKPSLKPLSEKESANVLDTARPFEDISSLGANFTQRLAETERFFGDRINGLQENISELEGIRSDLAGELDMAIAEQDEIRQVSAQEQIQALNEQQSRLEAELQLAVAEAEANGVDAVKAAEASAEAKLQEQASLFEGQIGDLQGEINNLTGARDSALSERDQAIAAQDTIRAQAAEQQAQALNTQAGDYQAQLDQLTGQSTQYQGQVSERDQTIADLQSQIQALQATPATVATPAPSPITAPINIKPIIDPNTGEEMTADRLQNLNPTIFGYGDFKGADPANIPVYTPPTASSMPTFIPQSVSQAVGNVPAYTPPANPALNVGQSMFNNKMAGMPVNFNRERIR